MGKRWKMVWNVTWGFYKKCANNQDFLNRWRDNDLQFMQSIANDGNNVNNVDMVDSDNQFEELTRLYNDQKLVSFRPGCVESSFVYFYLFHEQLKHSHLNTCFLNGPLDGAMRTNAGMYYQRQEDKDQVHKWYVDSFVRIMKDSTLTFCYCVLYYDLMLCARLDLKKTYYDYCHLAEIILRNSANKKILYVGSAVDSIQLAYDRGLDKLWKFEVPPFDLLTVRTPQTTAGVKSFPHSNMLETTKDIINRIGEYPDFDTAIFGCGAYGAPLIDELSRIYPDKNLIYLGSACYKMFGIISDPHMRWDKYTDQCNKEFLMYPIESSPDSIHPEPKYWS